ncbi:MAG TPA: hypothetical protein VNN73_20205 [Blastocatellia bacterium]|nr:hypothetical protein [Blastocatellia bacterium]
MKPRDLWSFLPLGFLITVLIETPILLIGLSPRHSLRRRLAAGVWLTACSYPVVILVFPLIFENAPEWVYITVAETFAPVSECALFWAAFGERGKFWSRDAWRDFAIIVIANLASFLIGEAMHAYVRQTR